MSTKTLLSQIHLPEDILYRRCLIVGMILFLLVSIAVPFIDLPKKTRAELEKMPPRITQLKMKPKVELAKPKLTTPKPEEKKIPPPVVAEKPKPVAKPKPEPKVEVAEPKPVKLQPLPEVAVQKPQPTAAARQAARAEASQAGVLAVANQLAGLKSLTQVPVQTKTIGKISNQTSDTAQAKDRVAALSKGGSGAQASQQVTATQTSEHQVAHTTQKVDAKVLAQGKTLEREEAVAEFVAQVKAAEGKRNEHSIRQIFEQNKSAIYAIYARAQRQNESLAGKLVLEIQIGPSGKVELCRLIDSELQDQQLVNRIMTRVQMFDFGADKVASVTMQYTFDFQES